MKKILTFTLILLITTSCSQNNPGPDKTIGGAILGAAWGAGAGAAVGNNISGSPTGGGALVGAGLGLISGTLAGYNYDSIENTQIKQEQDLETLKIQNLSNSNQLLKLQSQLDQIIGSNTNSKIYQAYFDVDSAKLRAGNIENLKKLADFAKKNPKALIINIEGHSDDSGNNSRNEELANNRAMEVKKALTNFGLASGTIVTSGFGVSKPVASNNTAIGRQLNRRVDIYFSSN